MNVNHVLLKEVLQHEVDLPDQITFKQWISNDRANLITEVLESDVFFEALIETLMVLKKTSLHLQSSIKLP